MIGKTRFLGLALAAIFCFIGGFAYLATRAGAEEMFRGKAVKPIDGASDFADPHKYNPGGKNLSFDGIELAATAPRTESLQETYTKLDFPMERVFVDTAKAGGDGKCLTCHEGIEEISANHKFACAKCHGGNADAADEKSAHANMVANPSDLSVAGKFCGECHKDHVSRVGGSMMATAAGEINSTRYLWGAQDSAKALYATRAVAGLKALPAYAESKELADDFLRKKCLRCHLNSPAPHRQGDYRATGCAACHMVYSNDGKTQTGDKAILRVANKNPEKLDLSGMGPTAKRGYPLLHKFTAAVPTQQCVRCHSGNRTGTEYLGMVEHDYEQMYRSPRFKGKVPPTIYGIEQHFLKADVHFEKGMACIDCHNQSEVEGDGKSYDLAHQAVKVRCQDCHGTPGKRPATKSVASNDPAIKTARSNPNYSVKAGDKVAVASGGALLANVKEEGGKLVLTSKVTGRKHAVPVLADRASQPANHRVAAHIEKMECHACHSRFVPQDFGLHLMREDYAGYAKWKRWREPDPNTMLALYSNLGQGLGDEVDAPNDHLWAMKSEKPSDPLSLDWVSGEKSMGIWYSAWSMRNWEDVILGYNSRGKISVFRPQYQYFISHIGPDFMKAKKDVEEIRKKIAMAKTETEALALKALLLEAERAADAQILKDSVIPKTRDGKIGFAMNPAAPHTTRTAVRNCEKCHQQGTAAGLGETQYLRAEKKNIPLMENDRMGIPINFQLSQTVAENGEALQTTTHSGARPLNATEIKSLMAKSKAYNAFRYTDLAERNYLSLGERENLTGGSKRPVVPGTSLGDVREVGSYYDWKRGGFWQTDPAVFRDEYFTSPNPEGMKADISKDPDILKEKDEIKKASGTVIDENANLNWVPKK